MNQKANIKTKKAYELTLTIVDGLMKKGENNLNPKELGLLRSLAEAVETYEDIQYPLLLPN